MSAADSSATDRVMFGPAWHRKVAGLHVLSVSGTFEEMGHQHGVLLREAVRSGPLPYQQRTRDKIVSSMVPSACSELARAALRHVIGRSVQSGLPPFARQTMRGLARGAGIPYADIADACTVPDTLAWLTSRFLERRQVAPAVRHRVALGFGCTSAVAWGHATRDGKLLHARNFDYQSVDAWPRSAAVVFHTPRDGQRYVSCTAAGIVLGGITAMNEAGLTLSVHQHVFTSRSRLGGTPIGVVGDMVMRKASTLDEAVAILARHRPIGGWGYVIADGPRREVLCWEEDPLRNVAHRFSSEEVFGYTNTYRDPELGEHERDLYPTYWRHDQGRYERVHEMLRQQLRNIDPASMASILADIGHPRCRLRDSIATTTTVGSVVLRPEDGLLWIAAGRAPASHGTFVPFSLRTMEHAPENESLRPSADLDPSALEAFEHWRAAYVAYVDGADLSAAREELARACELQSEQPIYWATAGMLGLQDGDARQAVQRLSRAIALGHPDEPRRASFHLWRARAHDLAGERRYAMVDYRAVLAMHADPAVREGARRGTFHSFNGADAAHMQVDMALGDVA